MNALPFLCAILPDTGLYVSWTKVDGKRSFNRVWRTIGELASYISDEDAKGTTVYHACASYRDAQGVWNERKKKMEIRCGANAFGARALWLDIDCGEGKPYADSHAAAEAVIAFCRAAGYPAPTYVGSGSGLHVYWPLDRVVTPQEWAELAGGLKAACKRFSLHADPSRTADIASVLRTPGTHNRKRANAELVQCSELAGPYNPSLFRTASAVPRSSAGSANFGRAIPGGFTPDRVTKALLANDLPLASAAQIADHCACVARLRDTGGKLPEPLWYAALGVLSWCSTDGEQLAHTWSSGFVGYTPAETGDKLQRTRQLTGATTCAKFESLEPAACLACPHHGNIKSPISLGFPTQPGANTPREHSSATPLDASGFSAPLKYTLMGAARELCGELLPALRLPYKWGRQNQLLLETENNDRAFDLLISEYPIFLAGVQVGELSKSKFSYHFRQYLPHSGWIDIHIAAEQCMGSHGVSKLFGQGAVIHEPKAFMKYVENAVDAFNAEWKLRMRYEQFGWKENSTAFLYGETLYRADHAEAVIGTEEIKTRAQLLVPTKGGSTEAWSSAANSLFQLGCEAQSFALLCSFASVFTAWHSSNEGGAIVSLVTRKSGSGKTTTLAGVSSVWGDGKGLALTNIDTAVAKGLTLGVLGNLPVIYDELWDRDPQIIRDFVMTFTNGRDKMRGTRDGEIKHTQASWQTILVSASNLSLVELLNSTGAVDAPGMRVLEFPLNLPATVSHAKGDRLRKALEANAGHAGDTFLRYLMEPEVLQWAHTALLQWTDDIWARTRFGSEHRFWVRTLGSVAVAAALVTKLGILAFQPSRIVEWAIAQMMAQRDEATLSGGTAASASVYTLSEFLAEHLNDTLVMPDRHHTGSRNTQLALVKPLRRLYVRYEIKAGRIFILEAPFKKWLLQKGVNARELLLDLKAEKVINTGRRNVTMSAGTELPGGQSPCVEVNALHPALSGSIAEIQVLQMVRSEHAHVQEKTT